MRRVLKWIGTALGGVVGLIVLAAVVGVVVPKSRMAKTHSVTPKAVTIPDDSDSIARDEHIVRDVGGCWGCHGEDMGGMMLLDDPSIMTLYGPNLTRGDGGAAASFTPEDWDLAIRHGVTSEGKPELLMPSQNFRFTTNQDLGDVVAYIESLPPVDNVVPEPKLGPMGYVLGLTEPSFLAASQFDQAAPPMADVRPGVTAEYGEYLVWLGQCHDCHGPNLSGRQLPLPGEPPSRNLTPGGELAGWSADDFIHTVRTGVTPGGETLQAPMADVIKILQNQSDDELTAIYLYLKSLPAKEFGK